MVDDVVGGDDDNDDMFNDVDIVIDVNTMISLTYFSALLCLSSMYLRRLIKSNNSKQKQTHSLLTFNKIKVDCDDMPHVVPSKPFPITIANVRSKRHNACATTRTIARIAVAIDGVE